jgi:hypothetical protein
MNFVVSMILRYRIKRKENGVVDPLNRNPRIH